MGRRGNNTFSGVTTGCFLNSLLLLDLHNPLLLKVGEGIAFSTGRFGIDNFVLVRVKITTSAGCHLMREENVGRRRLVDLMARNHATALVAQLSLAVRLNHLQAPVHLDPITYVLPDRLELSLQLVNTDPHEQILLVGRASTKLVDMAKTDGIGSVARAADSGVKTTVLANKAVPFVVVLHLSGVTLFRVDFWEGNVIVENDVALKQVVPEIILLLDDSLKFRLQALQAVNAPFFQIVCCHERQAVL